MQANTSQHSSAPKFTPISTLIEYSQKGLNNTEIAKIVGVSKNAIGQSFTRNNYVPDHLRAYKDSRADVFAHYQDQVLRTFTPEEIKKAPFASRVMLFGVLYDKERLERNLSSENVSVMGTMSKIDSRINELRNKVIPQHIDTETSK
jgi:transposase